LLRITDLSFFTPKRSHSSISLPSAPLSPLQANLLSSYIEFGQSLIEFGQSLIEFGQSFTEFGQSFTEFGQLLIEFGQSLIEFGQPPRIYIKLFNIFVINKLFYLEPMAQFRVVSSAAEALNSVFKAKFC
ncbi:hypothetical protein, partial [Nostoc sp.]|uniref:hypothetical protein n=1 Tax=Nostoc sp. TaxID=1180 RepID=UPI002FF63760